jgi:hypothetical protein
MLWQKNLQNYYLGSIVTVLKLVHLSVIPTQ